MSEQLIDGQHPDISMLAQELRAMADRIEANGAAQFGGCFVVLPPMGLDPLTTLILDNKQDPAQFFGVLQTKCKIALDSIDAQQRAAGGWR